MARPLKKHQPGNTVTVGIRMNADLRARLEAAAEAADRNLSQECTRRLRLSFADDDHIDEWKKATARTNGKTKGGQHA